MTHRPEQITCQVQVNSVGFQRSGMAHAFLSLYFLLITICSIHRQFIYQPVELTLTCAYLFIKCVIANSI